MNSALIVRGSTKTPRSSRGAPRRLPDARGYLRLPWPTCLNAEPTANLKVLPIDVRHDWPTALRQAGFDTDQPAAGIAESLPAFLRPRAQDLLLDNVTALSATGRRSARR